MKITYIPKTTTYQFFSSPVNGNYKLNKIFYHVTISVDWFFFYLGQDFKILRQNNIRRNFLNFSDPIVEVMHSEFSGRNGPLISYRGYYTKNLAIKV